MLNRRHFALTSAAALAAMAFPAVAAPSGAEIYALAAKGNGFTIGAPMAANTVYVFFDPACPHCAHLWGSVKPLLGKVKIVWIPVAVLLRSSLQQGATILSAPDPAAAMDKNEALVLSQQRGIPTDPAPKPEVLAKVQANTELLDKIGSDSVPTIVYKNPRTGQSGQVSGAMDTAQFAQLVGV